jgi:hypothetical protein
VIFHGCPRRWGVWRKGPQHHGDVEILLRGDDQRCGKRMVSVASHAQLMGPRFEYPCQWRSAAEPFAVGHDFQVPIRGDREVEGALPLAGIFGQKKIVNLPRQVATAD